MNLVSTLFLKVYFFQSIQFCLRQKNNATSSYIIKYNCNCFDSFDSTMLIYLWVTNRQTGLAVTNVIIWKNCFDIDLLNFFLNRHKTALYKEALMQKRINHNNEICKEHTKLMKLILRIFFPVKFWIKG